MELGFVTETAAYDLCDAVRAGARAALAGARRACSSCFLEVDQPPSDEAAQETSLRGVRKAQAKLATYYLRRATPSRIARQIYDDMKDERPERLRSIRDELLRVELQGLLGGHRPRHQLRLPDARAQERARCSSRGSTAMRSPRRPTCRRRRVDFPPAGKVPSPRGRPASARPSEDSPRVLVVDDEKVIREILSDFLTMEGYVVHTVEDGETALRELERRSYNLVITDLKMPGMGGLELLEKIAELKSQRADRDHDRLRHRRDRDRGDEEGRLRLHPQAVQGRGGHARRRARARPPAAAGREHPAAEAVTLYKISEAIAQSLSLDTHPRRHPRRRARRGRRPTSSTLHPARSAHRAVRRAHRARQRRRDGRRRLRRRRSTSPRCSSTIRSDEPILAHGIKALRFFTEPPDGQAAGRRSARSRSRCSDRMIGMLNAYSYTRGNKFDEGQRKMLVGAGVARRGVDRERAPLRRPGRQERATWRRPTSRSRRTSAQTIVGFAHALEESRQVHARPLRARRVLLVADRARA